MWWRRRCGTKVDGKRLSSCLCGHGGRGSVSSFGSMDARLDSEPLARVVAAYEPSDAMEAADVGRLREAMGAGDVRPRQVTLHVTASALIVHPPSQRVLLRWHVKMRGWLQVGGHFDEDEHDPWEVACREAEEETGL